jgi:hypothetical protein
MPSVTSLERLESDVELWRVPNPTNSASDLFMVKDPARTQASWGPMAWDDAMALFEERIENAQRPGWR